MNYEIKDDILTIDLSDDPDHVQECAFNLHVLLEDFTCNSEYEIHSEASLLQNIAHDMFVESYYKLRKWEDKIKATKLALQAVRKKLDLLLFNDRFKDVGTNPRMLVASWATNKGDVKRIYATWELQLRSLRTVKETNQLIFKRMEIPSAWLSVKCRFLYRQGTDPKLHETVLWKAPRENETQVLAYYLCGEYTERPHPFAIISCEAINATN